MIYLKFKNINATIHSIGKISLLVLIFAKLTYSGNHEFTIASYNVENFFDLKNDGTEYKEYIPFTHDWNLNSYHQKLENISNVIKSLNASIIVLSEVENANILKELQRELKLKSCGYKYKALTKNSNSSTTQVAILSKFPIIKHSTLNSVTKSSKSYRNILEADFLINGDTLKIFALHWPSKRHPESNRILACQNLIARINKLPKNCDYIIAGDFNSNYNEAETFYTSNHDNTSGVTAINHILRTVTSSTDKPICFFYPKSTPHNSKIKYHYNPWLEVSPQKRYSYIYKGSFNTLDHILLSESLFDSLGISYKTNSFTNFTWDGRLLKDGVPYRWQFLNNKQGKFHSSKGFSDHLPIIAKFSTSPYSENSSRNKTCVEYDDPNLLCDFESGVEGWIVNSPGFTILPIQTQSFSGNRSLWIKGETSRNRSITKFSIKPSKSMKKTISMKLKGAGKIAIIVKDQSGNNFCYSNTKFTKVTKGIKYTEFNYKNWTNITFNLKTFKKNQRIDMIIKSYKDKQLNIYLDQIVCE